MTKPKISETASRRKFLVVGCGSIGKRHIKNLQHLGVANILAFDVRADRCREISSSFGIEAVESLEAAWKWSPDVAVIASPTSLHVSVATEAALRHCHLFIEKPLSHDWTGVEQLEAIIRRNGLISLVGCNMRFHPGLMMVKDLLEEPVVGRVIAARVEVGQYLPDWHPWEDYRQSYSARRDLGGGVILDAIHEIDYVRWLLGDVEGVTCLAGKLSRLEIDTEDTAAILFRFKSGAVGEVHLDYIQRVYSRTCQIIGEEGTIHWDYAAGQVRWYSARSREWKTFANPPEWDTNQMYLDEMEHYLRCLEGEEKPVVDIFESARILRIALAAKESARRRCWIELGSLNCNTQITS
jgi:predicted dehydrogenase